MVHIRFKAVNGLGQDSKSAHPYLKEIWPGSTWAQPICNPFKTREENSSELILFQVWQPNQHGAQWKEKFLCRRGLMTESH